MLPHCVTSTAKAESTNAISSGKLVSLVERSTQDPLPADSGSHLDNSIDSSGHDMEPSLLSPREAMALGIPNMPALSFESLREYIQTLQKKAGVLEQMELEREPSKYQIVHRIIKSGEPALYFDKPQWFRGERNSAALKSSLPLSSVRTFLDRNPDVSFLVYRDYHLESMSCESFDELESQVHHTGECIFTSAKDLTTGVSEFLESKPALGTDNIFNGNQVLVAPYLVVYHTRHVLENTLNKVNDKQRRQLTLLFDYILSEYADVYKTVDSLLERGKINARYIKYLFKPGDILVEGREDDTRGVLATSWLDSAPGSQQPKKSMHGKSMVRWQVFASSWRFNGVFSHLKEPLHLDILDSDDSEIDISSLRLRPLAFVQEIWVERLRRRGEMFWKCRDRHFVSHHEDKGRESHHSGDERYMVDLKTYSELHPSDQKASSDWREEQIDDVGAEAMKRDSPPDSNFVFLVPVKIKAYNLKQKKWVDLRVDRLSEVVWNKEAFKSLVLDNKTKNLIQALISNQLEAENSTDLISGKGNGLILLLHGGPGTGKTLTAESVAEIAEKPLFPVTCGDIGTEPEKVEIYLESALNLGKTWGCVVLLDEADVFLEQRSLADLQRNALVSVFLRVLEYYDGILVLTSNRVGTFDEAFKSRIQLALHYANLSAYQREKIWRNFFERLRKIGVEKIDFDDLEDHLEHLSKIKMNGRQIRNSITTARQYAKWKGETLNYVMLKDIVETSGRFDVYLEKLNGGYSQDQLAEDEGIRLSETAVSDRS
jgi:DNA polymerase III delta prime subunit